MRRYYPEHDEPRRSNEEITDFVLQKIRNENNDEYLDEYNDKIEVFFKYMDIDRSIINSYMKLHKIPVLNTVFNNLAVIVFENDIDTFVTFMEQVESEDESTTRSSSSKSFKSTTSTSSSEVLSKSKEIVRMNRHFSVPYKYDIREHDVPTHSMSFREITRYIAPDEKFYLSRYFIDDIKKFINERLLQLQNDEDIFETFYIENTEHKKEMEKYVKE